MIAACDMALRLNRGTQTPVPFEEYSAFIEESRKNFFYKNRLNIFGISQNRIVSFLNNFQNEYHFRFIGRKKLTEAALGQAIEKSLNKGLPVIIRVGENGKKLPYIIRSRKSPDTLRQGKMRWHYITAVGLDNDALIFYTWGRKGKMKLSDLYRHFGFTGGIITAE